MVFIDKISTLILFLFFFRSKNPGISGNGMKTETIVVILFHYNKQRRKNENSNNEAMNGDFLSLFIIYKCTTSKETSDYTRLILNIYRFLC